jgi:hypothetical protein
MGKPTTESRLTEPTPLDRNDFIPIKHRQNGAVSLHTTFERLLFYECINAAIQAVQSEPFLIGI